MRAGGQALQDDCRGGGAGTECEGVLGMLDSSDGGLKVCSVGVAGSRVFVFADGLADGRLSKGGGQRDGFDDGAGDWVVW